MEMPMFRSGELEKIPVLAGVRCALFWVALLGVTPLCILHAQNPSPTAPAAAKDSAIDVPSAPASPTTDLRDPSTPAASSAAASPETNTGPQWSRSMLDPFQPGPNFGNFSGNPASGPGFGRRSPGGAGQMGDSGINGAAMGNSGMRGRQNSASPVFPASDGPVWGTSGLNGALPAVPSFNQLLRGRYTVPLNSVNSRLQFNFQDQLHPGQNMNQLSHAVATGMFTTSDLGNGMFLSAGTSYGRIGAGAPAAGLGTNQSGDLKHSGPSLAIKLSF
jgi:hypothetical protein